MKFRPIFCRHKYNYTGRHVKTLVIIHFFKCEKCGKKSEQYFNKKGNILENDSFKKSVKGWLK